MPAIDHAEAHEPAAFRRGALAAARAIRRAWLITRVLFATYQDPLRLRMSLRGGRVSCGPAAPRACNQLLVDVSVLARYDAGTGIQRVTRELLGELTAAPPTGYTVRSVRASRWRRYRYTDGVPAALKIRAGPGDIFLGLDLTSRILPRHRVQLARWQFAGVRICFVVYDLLPLCHPEWFTRRNALAYRNWIHSVVVHSDAVVCGSRSVAAEFSAWLERLGRGKDSLPEVGWFHYGARRPNPSTLSERQTRRVTQIAQGPFILMVGTIEARKGYGAALDAFDVIWRTGDPIQLVIVGQVGWKVASLLERIRAHPRRGTRLHWFDDADDATLDALYAASSGVLLASHGEGFGLPILEAALHGKPLLLRDLPVLREAAGAGATYFGGHDEPELAEALINWLTQLRSGTATSSATIAPQTWSASARQLTAQLISHCGSPD